MSETNKIVTTGNMETFKDLLEQEYIKGLSVSGKTITYTKGDGTTGTITTQDTDTHYTTKLKVGASSSAIANAAASNGSVYLNVLDNTTVRDSHLIKGAGATTVTSDANGVITISSTDTNTNTTYSAGNGISLSGTTFSNSGVRSIASGSTANVLSVNTNGTTSSITINNVANASAATKATQDSAGQQINTTYIKGLSVSGKTITYTKGDGTTGTITTQDTNTDTKVTQNAVADASYTNYRPLVWGSSNSGTKGFTPSTVTDGVYTCTGLYVQPSSGLIHATTFEGALSGNASTATKATQDSSGQQINTTYIKSLSVSGKTITYTKGDGTTGTITTQDTNTTYSTGTASVSGLTKLYTGTGTNTDGTMTQSAIKSALDVKAPLASPALTGTPTAPTAGNSVNNTQIANTAFVHSVVNEKIAAADAMIFKGTIGTNGTVTALPSTHKTGWAYKVITAGTFAGQKCEIGDLVICLTDGTSATDSHWTVVQTNIDGAVTGPASSVDARVAVFNGTTGKVIKDSGYTIGKSVPSNAVFTDTHYTTGLKVGASATTTANAAASNGAVYLNILDNTTVRDSHLIKGAGATTVTSDANGVITITSSDTNTNTTYSAGTGISLSGTTFSNSGVRSIAAGSSTNQIKVNTGGTESTITVNNVANATSATKATQDSAGQQINTTYIKGLSVSGKTITYTKGDGTTGTITTQDTNTTYNFSGTTFYSGNQNTAEHDANNALKNGHYYYTSNGPTTSLGASTADGGLYVQSYGDTWVGQIAQDYRNGRLFVRGKNNGTWQSWLKIAVAGDIPSSLKNPNTLTISLNGTSQGAYDGSNAKSINITASSIGAATNGHTHNYAGSSSAGGAATKALQDGNGNVITSTYVNLGSDQTITAQKTFEGGVVFGDTSSYSCEFMNLGPTQQPACFVWRDNNGKEIARLNGNYYTGRSEKDGMGNVITSTYAPKYEYSTTDLTAGVSSLTTGKLYIVYE